MMWENVAFTSRSGITIGLKESICQSAVYSDVMDTKFIGMLPPLPRRLRLKTECAGNGGADLGAVGRPMQAEIGE
jgi:hypothetical protein